MKIKKTLAIIMAATLSLATMTGCSKATENYSKELTNISNWEASTVESTGTVSIDANGEKNDITFTATGYNSGDKGYSEVKFNDTKGEMKIPDIKCYVEDGICYINKSYYEGTYTMNGQPVPAALANIKEDYIAVDSGINSDTLKTLTTKPDALIELSKLVFGDNNNLDLPYSQNGREYTLNLDTDATVDLGVGAIKAAANNIDKINSNFNLNLSTEDMNNFKTSVSSEEFNSGIKDTKTSLAGTSIYSKKVFSDNDYTSDVNINLKIKDSMNMSILLKEKMTKSEAKTIDIPTSKIKLTQQQYMEITTQANETGNTQVSTEQTVSSIIKTCN